MSTNWSSKTNLTLEGLQGILQYYASLPWEQATLQPELTGLACSGMTGV